MEFSEEPSREIRRLELFSDGVFAIAITLLVLDLVQILHPAPTESIIQHCLHHWQSFFAFVVGFITIMICWVNHHVAMSCIAKTDVKFLWVNGSILFLVTLTPFPTAVLAEYLVTQSHSALAIYGFNYFLISCSANWVCSYAYNHDLIHPERRIFFHKFKFIFRTVIVYTAIAFIVCFISPWFAMFLYMLMFIGFSTPVKLSEFLERIGLYKA